MHTSSSGGNSSGVASLLSSGVTRIASTLGAFAALKNNGSVVTWGSSSSYGGGGDSSGVASRLSSGVTRIASTLHAFAALKSDGSVVTWGSISSGGNSSGVASLLSSNVSQIFSTYTAFAALKVDGSVVTWGNSSYGGNSSGVASLLSSGVKQIFSTDDAFAALKADGSVVTWGYASSGGNSSGVANRLSSGVSQIFSNGSAFAALKADGSVVTWGNSSYGGNSSGVAAQLSSGVVSFADPFHDDRLVAPTGEPSITLAVSPASVAEDGSANLVYTFTRTGPTTSSLTVNYTEGGTATLGTDYTGIAATPATKTVTFAAGSATAVVTVDPTADTTIEPNETVALTLAAGTGYSIGTTAAVVGTISNDDPPATTAAISAINDNVGLITGTVANGGRSDDRTPTISGTLSAALASGETLRLYNGNTLLGSATVNNTAKTWSYTPTLPLSAGTTYSFTARVADAAGNLAAASAARSFVLDTTAPTVASFSPADGAIGVDPAANILFDFSESIQRGTGTMALRVGSTTGAIAESFDAATSSRLSISSGRLALNPTSNLLPNTQYVLTFPAGSLRDRAGNPYAGTTTYDFRTVNAVTGTAANNILSFTSTVDRLTGFAGADTFRLTSLSHSLLPAVASTPIDRITDLVTGLDTIDAPVARSLAQALNPVPLGRVSELSANAITALLTPASFPALTTTSTGGVASFTFSDPVAGTRTFLAINNGTAGFSAATDAILEITGYNGSLSSLQVF
jgi:hypothetical protein